MAPLATWVGRLPLVPALLGTATLSPTILFLAIIFFSIILSWADMPDLGAVLAALGSCSLVFLTSLLAWEGFVRLEVGGLLLEVPTLALT